MTDSTTGVSRPVVLVVDDTPQNLSLMSDLLDSHYIVKLAPSGARALKIATSTPVDLVLLDIMMPEMDGYEVCRALKENPATVNIPVVFLSAMDAMEDEERGLLAGAMDYITKPISPPILLARVRNQLALKEAADALRAKNALLEQEKIRARELLARVKQVADKLLEQTRAQKQERQRIEELLLLLARSYRLQGNLDGAWEQLQQSPPSEAAQEELRALGLALQGAARDADAATVFAHLKSINPAFTPPTHSAPRGGDEAARPTMLGRYRIDSELGRGAMGCVYLGADPKIGRVVAIKCLTLDDSAADAQERRLRFFREAESAGRLNHPNIVAIYDVGEDQGRAYIAMEYLKGRDLSAHTQPGRLLSLDKALGIVEHVAQALGYAHGQEVIHRDIKPANIVHDADSGSVKVTDFGIASIAGSENENQILGTPTYMSPEHVAGAVQDGRSDLFSLGAVLYVLACGHRPFAAESVEKMLDAIRAAPATDIRIYQPDLPDCVAALLHKALAKEPAARFQSGEEMARALSLCRRSITVFGS